MKEMNSRTLDLAVVFLLHIENTAESAVALLLRYANRQAYWIPRSSKKELVALLCPSNCMSIMSHLENVLGKKIPFTAASKTI